MKKVFAINLFVLLVIASCKKDPSLTATTTNNKTTTTGTVITNTVAVSYNITYHLWYPYQTISVPYNTVTRDSLLITLDSINTHNIELYINQYFAGVSGGGMPMQEYGSDAEVFRGAGNTTVFMASLNPTSSNYYTAIITNDWINDSLAWATELDLKSIAYSGFGQSDLGDWDLSRVNSAYIGIKIVTSLGNKYGWIKINVPNSTTMTMEAQALNNNYGQYIQAGQTH
jgi:hypothetical protein